MFKRMFNSKKLFYFLFSVAGLVVFVLAWNALHQSNSRLFPSPIEVWERFLKLIEKPPSKLSVLGHIGVSLRRVFLGLGLGWSTGLIFGVLIGWNRTAQALLGTVFELLRPIPPLAWIPLITIWCGVGEYAKVLIVFVGVFSTMALNTRSGIRMAEQMYIDVGRVFQYSKMRTLMEIIVPSALPVIFAGIRISTGAGWMAIVAAEMMSATSGVGFLIIRGMESGDTPLIFVGMCIIGLIGAFLSIVTNLLERLVCPWKTEARK